MMTFDPRTISTPVFNALQELHNNTQDTSRLKEQKSQAVELYTYLSTWGMMRLKAEQIALNQEGKREVVREYFRCLEELSGLTNLVNDEGLNTLKNLNTDLYLGLTGLGLELAREFSFWANAIYSEVEDDDR